MTWDLVAGARRNAEFTAVSWPSWAMSKRFCDHVITGQPGVLRIRRFRHLPRLRSGRHLAVPHDHRHSVRDYVFQTRWRGHRAVWACDAGYKRLGMTGGAPAGSDLLVPPPLVFEPTSRMPPGWITVRPVDDSALLAWLVLAVKRHRVSLS